MKRTILFDGDVAAYQFGFAYERATEWHGGLWTLHAHATEAEDAIDNFMTELMTDLEGDELIVVLSDDDDKANWRFKLAEDYKANRKGKRKPMLHAHLRQYMKDGYEIFQRPTLEGDDTLGILMTSTKIINSKREKICVSIDKDMLTIPGLHYNASKKDKGVIEITEEVADWHHMMQTLTGDTVDNYPGLKGCGPVKAARILEDADNGLWVAVVAAYIQAGLGMDEALRQARIARILRNTDYDFKKKKVILWEPGA